MLNFNKVRVYYIFVFRTSDALRWNHKLFKTRFRIKTQFQGSFQNLRLGFEVLMFYLVLPSSVFFKSSFILD